MGGALLPGLPAGKDSLGKVFLGNSGPLVRIKLVEKTPKNNPVRTAFKASGIAHPLPVSMFPGSAGYGSGQSAAAYQLI